MRLDQLAVEREKIKSPFKGIPNRLLAITGVTGKVGEIITPADAPP